ncbi:hypothetical protein B0H19DRAFT_1073636 [Mycena capillaripes]|nr:hypothetical protein B0H19DRAFT_1073636 [Mycena capillaripes]
MRGHSVHRKHIPPMKPGNKGRLSVRKEVLRAAVICEPPEGYSDLRLEECILHPESAFRLSHCLGFSANLRARRKISLVISSTRWMMYKGLPSELCGSGRLRLVKEWIPRSANWGAELYLNAGVGSTQNQRDCAKAARAACGFCALRKAA